MAKKRRFNPNAWQENQEQLARYEAKAAARNEQIMQMRMRQVTVFLFSGLVIILLLAACLLASGIAGV